DDMLFAQLLTPVAAPFVATRPTLNGIEIVAIEAKGHTVELDLSDANGVKTILNAGSSETANLIFNHLKNLVDVAIRDTNSHTSVTFNPTVVAGAADALKLQLEGAGVVADRAY